ncbi:MAG TPA: hypothetical protein VKX46_22615 [Ktedonobacteraceae bacterium]|jgi:hypothetical protein|nr:hypothetical protein [Ktedonobacteraceae bacterium]
MRKEQWKATDGVFHCSFLIFLAIYSDDNEPQTSHVMRDENSRKQKEERNLPLDEIGRRTLAERILNDPPKPGYLTISNALQWRLQYTRAISFALKGNTEGVENLYVWRSGRFSNTASLSGCCASMPYENEPALD